MLRPQVFALQKGEVEIGLICSEKQAIDATLESLAKEDPRFGTVADRYWNARGGSYTDGGAFIFTVKETGPGKMNLTCADKFGRIVDVPTNQAPHDSRAQLQAAPAAEVALIKDILQDLSGTNTENIFAALKPRFLEWDYSRLSAFLDHLVALAKQDALMEKAITLLSLLLDRRYSTGNMRRRSVLQMVSGALDNVFRSVPIISDTKGPLSCCRIDFDSRSALRKPKRGEKVLVADASLFEPEGDDSFAVLVSKAYGLGWKRFICFGHRGQRFLGCGFGPDTKGVQIDAFGSTGDYMGSGMDGLEIYVHGNAQDQLGQIMKSGKLVVYGDVGQTFMYGAKGGEVYVLGNAAGRPLINAVGKPRVVINGTALDYLAESFMAGDPYKGGGFVIMNGLSFDNEGKMVPLEIPYPGSNIFSLASGGAIFVRDPHKTIVPEQLNGGQILPFRKRDWKLILPYLKENERLFGIGIEDLLTVDGKICKPEEVYRTIGAVKLSVLSGSADMKMNEEYEEFEEED